MSDYENLLAGGITTRAQRRASQNQRPQSANTNNFNATNIANSGYSRNASDSSTTETTDSITTTKIENLEENPDYIALQSTLSLLSAQKQTAKEDIKKLQELKNKALEDPEKFLSDLQSSRSLSGAPKPQDVAKAPIIPWQSYGISNPGLDDKLRQGLVEPSASFGAVRLFDESFGERNRADK